MKKNLIGFPKTISDFRKQFGSEDACRDYLIRCRWPDGFACDCGNKKYWPKRGGKLLECTSCHKNHSPMVGTIMHGSHVSLENWFQAAYFVSTFTPGISAVQLQRQLGLGSYRTAWFILGRLRKAMVNDNREKLRGLVEIDESYVGGVERRGTPGFIRGQGSKRMVIGAVEVRRMKLKSGKMKEVAGRLRLDIIKNNQKEGLRPFIVANVETRSRVRTDGWHGYYSPTLDGYKHIRKVNDPDKYFHAQIPHIHRVFSNLKTWLRGTHHGVDPKYLQLYLDEFVFRFNRRHYPMVAFRTLLGISTRKSPISLRKIKSQDSSA